MQYEHYEQSYPAYAPTAESDGVFIQKGFDPRRQIKTRGGDPVAILTTNGPGPAPVIGMIQNGPYRGYALRGNRLHRWNYNGKSYDATCTTPRSLDLEPNVCRPFNWNLPYKTKGGMDVSILTTMRNGARNVVALVGGSQIVLYYPNGMTHDNGKQTVHDLINV